MAIKMDIYIYIYIYISNDDYELSSSTTTLSGWDKVQVSLTWPDAGSFCITTSYYTVRQQ